MRGENGIPETPDWQPEPRPWSAERCCKDCSGVCETEQQHIWIHSVRAALDTLDDTEASRIALTTGLSIAEITELGGLGDN